MQVRAYNFFRRKTLYRGVQIRRPTQCTDARGLRAGKLPPTPQTGEGFLLEFDFQSKMVPDGADVPRLSSGAAGVEPPPFAFEGQRSSMTARASEREVALLFTSLCALTR